MLFAESFDIIEILPWVVIAIAVVTLVGIIAKCISNYRVLKRNKTYVKRNGEIVPMLAIRGEYFVMSKDVEYTVGESGQFKAGYYILKGDGYDNFTVTINGETRELNGAETLQLSDGDKLTADTCDLLIKPYTNTQEKNNGALV